MIELSAVLDAIINGTQRTFKDQSSLLDCDTDAANSTSNTFLSKLIFVSVGNRGAPNTHYVEKLHLKHTNSL